MIIKPLITFIITFLLIAMTASAIVSSREHYSFLEWLLMTLIIFTSPIYVLVEAILKIKDTITKRKNNSYLGDK